jgi:hypothetical protein
MNGAELHLAINHLPLFATIFGLAFLAFGLWRPAVPVVRRSGLVLLVLGGLGGGATYFTGEPAEEVVEDMPGITRERIHEHEESAELATIIIGITGLIGLGILWRRRGQPIDKASTIVAAGATLLAFGVLARTAWLGGQIHHPELRPGGAGATEQVGVPARGSDVD